MVRRTVLGSLLIGLVSLLVAGSASANTISAIDLGGGTSFDIQFTPSETGTLLGLDVPIDVVGTTFLSVDLTLSAFQGKFPGPTGGITLPTRVESLGGSAVFSGGLAVTLGVPFSIGTLNTNGPASDLIIAPVGTYAAGNLANALQPGRGSSILPAPEPATILLLGVAAGALAFVRRREV